MASHCGGTIANELSGQRKLIDLHCHILPGLDDGARDDAAALEMLRIAAADGIGTIVATPHAQHVDAGQVLIEVERLNQSVRNNAIDIAIVPGAEVRIAPDLVERFQTGQLLTVNATDYVLLELYLTHEWKFSTVERVVERLHDAGLWPILVHPERFYFIQRDPEILARLVQRNVPVQINAPSLTGYHGPEAQETAEILIQQGLAHLLASDAHNPEWRAPCLRSAYQRVGDLFGQEPMVAMVARAEEILAGKAIRVS